MVCALLLAHGMGIPSGADEDRASDVSQFPILNEQIAGGPVHLMLHRWLMGQMKQADQKIEASAAAINSMESLRAWQQDTRNRFLQALGAFPERTPLNPVVTGTITRDLYRVEKILFESRPKHYVTAALFLPAADKFAPPYPGILIPCGHSLQGKGIDTYQRGAVLAAANGMAAMIYDPIDQGERIQTVDADGKFSLTGVAGHNRVGAGAILLGWNTASFRVWDGMRALDYLTSRSDIDPKRIGCMGNSGGGTLTAFLTALDDRIQVSAPSCYITSLTQVCESIGPQDAEQNIFGQMAFGMDHAEFLLMRVPAPICICAARKDFFPIEGARNAFNRLSSVGKRLGFEERITMVENDGPHGWAEPLRLGANRWMNRWMRDTEDFFVPPETEMGISEQEILVTERGQVMLLPGARSVYDLMRDEWSRLKNHRQPVSVSDADGNKPAEDTAAGDSNTAAGSQLSGEKLRTAVRNRAGIRLLAQIPNAEVIVRGEISRPWGRIRQMTLQWREGLILPSLLYEPGSKTGLPVLLAHGDGKSAATDQAEQLAAQGRVVLSVDLTGFGEMQGAAKEFYGSPVKDEPAAVVAYLLGQSLTGLRAEDLLAAGRWLSREQSAQSVQLSAAGWAVTPALHAAVAEPELFTSVTLSERPMTWGQVIKEGARHRYSDLVHGALQDYDLSDLEAAVHERR